MKDLIRSTYEAGTEITGALSLVYDVIHWGDKIFTDRRNKVLIEFYKALLDGEVTEERIKYEKENILANEDQFYILLNLAIGEEEMEKAHIYANVYKYIRDNQKLEKKLKIKIIKIVKQLPYSALEILPYIYIHENFFVKGKTLNQILLDMESTNNYELKTLTQLDLFSEKYMPSKFKSKYNINNPFFNDLCIAFFTKKHLIPSNYGITIWENKNVLIITDDVFNEDTFGNEIKTLLMSLDIKSEISYYKSADATGFSDVIFLTDNAYKNDNFDEVFSKFGSRQDIRCIKVSNVTNPTIKNKDTIYIKEDIKKFKKLFSE